MENKKKLFFLLLPLVVLMLYDALGNVLFNSIEKGFTLFSVSEDFINTSASFIDATLATILSIICYLFYRGIFPKKQAEVSLSLKKGLVFALVIGFGVGGLSTLWLNFIDFIANYSTILSEQAESFSELYDDLEQGAFIWTFLAIVIVGPLVEEILFRGIIFHSLEKVTTLPWFAFVLSGVMFGIWHGSFIQGVYTAMMGIIVGYFMKKSRSLFLVFFAHAINNLSGMLPPCLDTDFNNTLLTIISYLCIVPMFYILFYLHRQSQKERQLNPPTLDGTEIG